MLRRMLDSSSISPSFFLVSKIFLDSANSYTNNKIKRFIARPFAVYLQQDRGLLVHESRELGEEGELALELGPGQGRHFLQKHL